MAAYYIEALIPPEGTSSTNDRWNTVLGSPVELTYSFMAAAPIHATTNEKSTFVAFTDAQMIAARAALTLYAGIANVSFRDVSDTGGGQILFGSSAQIATAGYAYYPHRVSGFLFPSSGDVYLDNSPTDTALAPGESGYATIVHEIGHALGLKHPFESWGDHGKLPDEGDPIPPPVDEDSTQYTVMAYDRHPHDYYFDGAEYRQIYPSTPMLYDVAAIQYLYGANLTTRTGDDTYGFDPATPFFMTIWDAGGTDTIDVSGFTPGCEIDLRGGQFSSIAIPSAPDGGQATYDGTDNLAIALGAVIENAVGGSGDDTITGNTASNALQGGDGSDVLEGGAANDVLAGGSGDDTLAGGTGADTLAGGADADTFLFACAPLAGNADTVTDFIGGADHNQVGLAYNRLLSRNYTVATRYVYADTENTTAALAGRELPFHPRHYANFALNWQPAARTVMGPTATFRSRRFRDEDNLEPLNAGWAFGFNAYWESADKRWSVAGVLDQLHADKKSSIYRHPVAILQSAYRF